jgi:hypothetical protein
VKASKIANEVTPKPRQQLKFFGFTKYKIVKMSLTADPSKVALTVAPDYTTGTEEFAEMLIAGFKKKGKRKEKKKKKKKKKKRGARKINRLW